MCSIYSLVVEMNDVSGNLGNNMDRACFWGLSTCKVMQAWLVATAFPSVIMSGERDVESSVGAQSAIRVLVYFTTEYKWWLTVTQYSFKLLFARILIVVSNSLKPQTRKKNHLAIVAFSCDLLTLYSVFFFFSVLTPTENQQFNLRTEMTIEERWFYVG